VTRLSSLETLNGSRLEVRGRAYSWVEYKHSQILIQRRVSGVASAESIPLTPRPLSHVGARGADVCGLSMSLTSLRKVASRTRWSPHARDPARILDVISQILSQTQGAKNDSDRTALLRRRNSGPQQTGFQIWQYEESKPNDRERNALGLPSSARSASSSHFLIRSNRTASRITTPNATFCE